MDYYANLVANRRIPFPPEKIGIDQSHAVKPPFEFPQYGQVPPMFTPVDSDQHVTSSFSDLAVHVSDEQFDNNNWWMIMATGGSSQEPRPFAIVYYEGNFDAGEAYGIPTNIPFHRDAVFRPAWFEVGIIRGVGLRFVISYGPE